jgi:hypothetical protein
MISHFMDLKPELKVPRIIQLSKLGESAIGYISVAQSPEIPFEIKRVFWTYYTPESVVRGRHAHHKLEQVLIAAAGRILVTTEMPDGKKDLFELNHPHEGVYIPAYCWHTMQYSHNAVQLSLASIPYLESDYIRDYEAFRNSGKK